MDIVSVRKQLETGLGSYGNEQWDKEQIMAFKMKGFSPYKMHIPGHTDPPGPNSTTDGDVVSGRSQIEEIKHDIERLKKDIANPKYSTKIVNKLRNALKENQEALVRLQKAK